MFLIPNLIFWTVAVIFMTVAGHSHAASLRFDAVPVGTVAGIVLGDVYKAGYVLSSGVLAKAEPVSVNLELPDKLGQPAIDVLQGIGVQVDKRTGFYLVRLPGEIVKQQEETQDFFYRPKYRTAAFLTDHLSSFMNTPKSQGHDLTPIVSVTPGTQPATQQAAQLSSSSSKSSLVVFTGQEKEIKRVSALLQALDTKPEQVFIRANLYEVYTGSTNDSSLSVALSILNGKLKAAMPGLTSSGNGSFSLSTGTISIDAVLNILNSDSRVKTLSSPSLLLLDGEKGSVSIGQDVPVLSNVTTSSTGSTTQGVEYRSSGVLFDLTPEIHDDLIKVALKQTVSSFAKTTSGVNTSPTLTKREFTTTAALKSGDVVILGGLYDTKKTESGSRIPFLPSFFDSSSKASDETQILLVLYVERM